MFLHRLFIYYDAPFSFALRKKEDRTGILCLKGIVQMNTKFVSINLKPVVRCLKQELSGIESECKQEYPKQMCCVVLIQSGLIQPCPAESSLLKWESIVSFYISLLAALHGLVATSHSHYSHILRYSMCYALYIINLPLLSGRIGVLNIVINKYGAKNESISTEKVPWYAKVPWYHGFTT